MATRPLLPRQQLPQLLLFPFTLIPKPSQQNALSVISRVPLPLNMSIDSWRIACITWQGSIAITLGRSVPPAHGQKGMTCNLGHVHDSPAGLSHQQALAACACRMCVLPDPHQRRHTLRCATCSTCSKQTCTLGNKKKNI